MTEAAVLRAALVELLEKCNLELSEHLKNSTIPDGANVEEYLSAAESALQRLVDAADDKECSSIAREVLIAVARFRTALGSLTPDDGLRISGREEPPDQAPDQGDPGLTR